jgi:hypothetical protein
MPKRITVPKKVRVRDNVARIICPKLPPIEPSLTTLDRLDELSVPTPTELPCALCDGVGLPKIAGTDMRICVVCRDALKDVPRTERKGLLHNHEDYMWYRLPFFTQWLVAGRYEVDDDQLKHTA